MTRAERRQQWDHFIAAYKSSGQSVREWCAANGVDPNRLWYWLRRTKTEDVETKSTRWLSVSVTGQAEACGCSSGWARRTSR